MSRRVIRELIRRGHKAYWVGGCIRDEQLRLPVKDRDVATSALPDEVVAIFPGARQFGRRYGVIGVPDGDHVTEVATFRRDHGYSDGRRPDTVTYTIDEREDVQRRDFTINGLLQIPGARDPIDHVGGMRDLKLRLVRAIGDPQRRFEEDRLRMLRAVRFAARLDFHIEPRTMAAIQKLAPQIDTVAPERVRTELGRILTDGRARRGFELLSESRLLPELLREVEAMKGVAQPPQFHPEGDVWVHTMMMLENLQEPEEALAWGVLLHDVGKPETYTETDRIRFHGHVERGVEIAGDICQRLRFSKADTAHVLALVGNHMKFAHLRQMRPGKLRRFLRQPRFGDHLELHRLDCLASHRRLQNYEFAAGAAREIAMEKPPARLLTGRDLIAAGYTPGPSFAEILSVVEDMHLEERLSTRDEALEFVRGRFPAPSA